MIILTERRSTFIYDHIDRIIHDEITDNKYPSSEIFVIHLRNRLSKLGSDLGCDIKCSAKVIKTNEIEMFLFFKNSIIYIHVDFIVTKHRYDKDDISYNIDTSCVLNYNGEIILDLKKNI